MHKYAIKIVIFSSLGMSNKFIFYSDSSPVINKENVNVASTEPWLYIAVKFD
jgi:hypothetical protein